MGLGSNFVSGRPHFRAVERKVHKLRGWIACCVGEIVGMREGRLGAGRERRGTGRAEEGRRGGEMTGRGHVDRHRRGGGGRVRRDRRYGVLKAGFQVCV